jgi:hypothetical protein
MPDPKLEDYLRDLAGLPPAEHDGQAFGAPPMPGAEAAAPGFDAPPSLEEELEIPEVQEPLDGDLE